MKTIIKKIKLEGNFVATKRCIHSCEKLIGSCNINISEKRKYTTEEINNRINKGLQLQKCKHCLDWEDIEVE